MRLLASLTLAASLLALAGCQSLFSSRDAGSVLPTRGVEPLKGLADSVSIRRNALGMPLIESHSFHDALFALGYVHAGDRLTQMVSLRLLAQGRLAELEGEKALDVDRFMRTVNLKRDAELLYRQASPRLKRFFEVYARGVNAYLFRYRQRLPQALAAAGYRPEYWKPEDSALLLTLLSFSLSGNLQEELAALILAQQVGSDLLPWLLPVYPDEPLAHVEGEKLKNLKLEGAISGLPQIARAARAATNLYMPALTSSNNWAVAASTTRHGKSLLANDMHQPTGTASLWTPVYVRAPKYQAAGLSIAGLPLILSGFNGKLAWSLSEVYGDNQDLMLEQIKQQGSTLYYQANGRWVPATERYETFFVKGQRPIRERIVETRNGPLLNAALGARADSSQPTNLQNGYGLALKLVRSQDDRTLDALFDLSRAGSVDQAFDSARDIQALPVNLIIADTNHIGWQVTGRYPNRVEGRGLLPSPGWDGRYGWDGYADPMLHPYDQDPPQGWLGTANQRITAPGYGMQLSSSWADPARAERLAELASRPSQDGQSAIAMQLDQVSTFASKLRTMLTDPGMQQPLAQAIAVLPTADRERAEYALRRLETFDGHLSPDSAGAAIYGAFLHESTVQTFGDELGAPDSAAWHAFVDIAARSYSAQADHLLGQVDSPFWDDRRTTSREDKPAILARSLSGTIRYLENTLGTDRARWQWGQLRAQPGERMAGGDHNTLNASAFAWGSNLHARTFAATRLIADFAAQEPLTLLNSPGQSDNPASTHFNDGLDAWHKGRYMSVPFNANNLDRAYGQQRLLLTPARQ